MHICLLDIDGTILLSGGAGQAAFAQTLADEFGIAEIIHPVMFAGRSDRAIVMELFRLHGIDESAENWMQFCHTYVSRLEAALVAHEGHVLPGAHELVLALANRDDVALGLLTGNVLEGAKRKLLHYDLWHWFAFGGYGDDHTHRNDIAAAALAAARAHVSRIRNVSHRKSQHFEGEIRLAVIVQSHLTNLRISVRFGQENFFSRFHNCLFWNFKHKKSRWWFPSAL